MTYEILARSPTTFAVSPGSNGTSSKFSFATEIFSSTIPCEGKTAVLLIIGEQKKYLTKHSEGGCLDLQRMLQRKAIIAQAWGFRRGMRGPSVTAPHGYTRSR
ncbi:hypothetical protein ACQX2R_11490 [Corynebacterium diphtheriae]|uniref:hypothetical protein n=1 Tax=Corynebacterium diphtheriae TaxID=1717 RepID=UPI000A1E1CFD|nr:hypothetical protein [Corynebacterium diphtheriae]OSQ00063.1 hypothetical protein B1A65_08345 [Corynebacterium diphtheriae]OSQ19789.1 hypothetical protein B1A51_11680 [Corynebacterium diphtheriae]RKW98447.1 hypothetical protein D9B96_09800 [Corynebacterium diphtheriae]RKX00396.1 hypothetical protein D9B85_10385 [Corynebacterium diphtheriae]CAB0567083.1 hypothetical protein CIP107512_01912 [Corynebacterium diphtheriae]